ncbi:methyl-accepting chemotaxis protein [Lachnospiraceae bacterium ZAX-1]
MSHTRKGSTTMGKKAQSKSNLKHAKFNLKDINSSLKGKMLLSIGILLIAIIFILSAIALFNLHNAYAQIISSTKNNFDSNIKIATQTLVSSLQTNYQQFLDNEISEEAAMENAKKIVRDTRYSSSIGKVDDGYFWADMADGLCVVHYNPNNEGAMRYDAQDKEGTYYIQNFIKLGDSGGGFSDFYFGKPGDEDGSYKKRGYTLEFEPYGWYISTGNYYEDTDTIIASVYARERIGILVLFGTSLAITVIGILILSRSLENIVSPIRKVADQIHILSLGDTTQGSATLVTRNDEIGTLQQSIKNLSETMVAQSVVIEHIADGDLSLTYTPRSENDSVGNSLQTMLASNNHAFREINNTSTRVADISSQVSLGAQTLAEGSTEQTTNIDRLSDSISSVLDQTKENARSAQDALENVKEVGQLMNESTQNMQQMQKAMDGISESSTGIAKVIKVIDDIAFQTNILALNAAVEAARAGQHGNGFAVVANEVRKLASKSADAAKETASLISNSAKRVDEGNIIVTKTGESMHAAATYSDQTYGKIEEIHTASRRQENAITEINKDIEQIMQVVQANSATSQESAALSLEMSDQATILASTVAHFKLSPDA